MGDDEVITAIASEIVEAVSALLVATNSPCVYIRTSDGYAFVKEGTHSARLVAETAPSRVG